jgi:hypothetical protein
VNQQLFRIFGVPGVLPDRKRGTPGLIAASPSTWWAWVRNGKAPPGVKIEGCTFWRAADLAAFVAGTWTPHADVAAVPEPQPVKRGRGRPKKTIPLATPETATAVAGAENYTSTTPPAKGEEAGQ